MAGRRRSAPAKQKAPPLVSKRRGVLLATSYFRATYRSTIIGAAAFHFRVRNGNGWCHCAGITRRLDWLGRSAFLKLMAFKPEFLVTDAEGLSLGSVRTLVGTPA